MRYKLSKFTRRINEERVSSLAMVDGLERVSGLSSQVYRYSAQFGLGYI
jgi:hypothetical protein